MLIIWVYPTKSNYVHFFYLSLHSLSEPRTFQYWFFLFAHEENCCCPRYITNNHFKLFYGIKTWNENQRSSWWNNNIKTLERSLVMRPRNYDSLEWTYGHSLRADSYLHTMYVHIYNLLLLSLCYAGCSLNIVFFP